MSHSLARYERLNVDDDELGQRHHKHMRYANEEIELETEHRLRQPSGAHKNDSDSNLDDCYLNGGHTSNCETGIGGGGGGARLRDGSASLTHHLQGSRFMQMAIGTLATILLYLSLSITLTFYQKALIKELGFPLTIVCYHLVIKYMLAAIVRTIYKCRSGKTRVQLDWRTVVRKMAPMGIASGIDIGFSNWGLELVPISLYTMTKSSTIVFILFFAILLGLEKKSLSLVFIVGLIASGLLMFSYKSTQFNALGFAFILVASLSSGIRWSFAQFVMQKSKLGLHNPVDMIYFMQPWMIASLVPLAITFEGQQLYKILRDLSGRPDDEIYTTIFKITLGAVLAFLMEVSEFLVLSQTSSLTLSIAGIFKDICQVALAVVLDGDKLSATNICGLVVLVAGISGHVIHKYTVLASIERANLAIDDLQYGETCSGGSNGLNGGHNTKTTDVGGGGSQHNQNHGSVVTLPNNVKQQQHSSQTVPLLDELDSDDSANDLESSDIIFDVLNRRDM